MSAVDVACDCACHQKAVIAQDLRDELAAGRKLCDELEVVHQLKVLLNVICDQALRERDRYAQRRADLSAAAVRRRQKVTS